MKRLRQFTVAATVTILMATLALVACSSSQSNANTGQQQIGATDWKAVGQALGKEGTMQPGDVYKVSLPRRDLQVTAVHSHMLTESPRLFFMHFWTNDDAQKLARGLRAALDKVNIAKSQAK